MEQTVVICIHEEKDIARARKTGRDLVQALQFQPVNQTRVVTAISELARNIYRYGEKGRIKLEVIDQQQKNGIKIIAQDDGPGIEDINKALTSGFSTSGSLGAGIPGVKNMMDEFEIDSSADKGTTVIAAKWQVKAYSRY